MTERPPSQPLTFRADERRQHINQNQRPSDLFTDADAISDGYDHGDDQADVRSMDKEAYLRSNEEMVTSILRDIQRDPMSLPDSTSDTPPTINDLFDPHEGNIDLNRVFRLGSILTPSAKKFLLHLFKQDIDIKAKYKTAKHGEILMKERANPCAQYMHDEEDLLTLREMRQTGLLQTKKKPQLVQRRNAIENSAKVCSQPMRHPVPTQPAKVSPSPESHGGWQYSSTERTEAKSSAVQSTTSTNRAASQPKTKRPVGDAPQKLPAHPAGQAASSDRRDRSPTVPIKVRDRQGPVGGQHQLPVTDHDDLLGRRGQPPLIRFAEPSNGMKLGVQKDDWSAILLPRATLDLESLLDAKTFPFSISDSEMARLFPTSAPVFECGTVPESRLEAVDKASKVIIDNGLTDDAYTKPRWRTIQDYEIEQSAYEEKKKKQEKTLKRKIESKESNRRKRPEKEEADQLDTTDEDDFDPIVVDHSPLPDRYPGNHKHKTVTHHFRRETSNSTNGKRPRKESPMSNKSKNKEREMKMVESQQPKRDRLAEIALARLEEQKARMRM